MTFYQDIDYSDWGVPLGMENPRNQVRSGGAAAGPNYDYDTGDSDFYTQPDTSGPVWGDDYSLYGLTTGFNGINDFDRDVDETADYFRRTGNRTWQDDANAGGWGQYGGYTGQASDGFDDPYNMGWNLREMQTAEGADRYGQDPGRYDPYSNDMLNRMSGNAYRGASWDPWNMGWSQREANTAQVIDQEGWDDPRYRAQREGITNNGNQVWDEEQRIYDQYGNIANEGGNPYKDPMEYLAAQNGRGEGRYEPMRGALATEFQGGVQRFEPQRGALATEFQSGRGMYEDPQAGLVGTMAGGRNQDESSTMGQVNQFGYNPGKYEGQREDTFRRFASGGGGYDDPTKQALKQTAAIPIQSQLGGIEQAVNRGVARTGNAAGAAGALVSGRLDAANQVSRNLNQAQIQMADAQRADQSTGLQGLGQLQGEGDARTTYALNAQQNQNAADRARQAQAANMYGQMSQAGDARKQAAAGLYGQMANESTAMKRDAANMYGQMAQESDQRWNSAFNQYNQLGQNKLTAQQLGLGAQQGMLGQQRGYQQQAFNNLGQLQGEQDASAQQAIQNRMTMENQARQRETQALSGYQQQQGMADSRYQTQLGTQMAMNEQARGRQQQALTAQERAIERNNANTLAGANLQAGLGNKQTQGELAQIQAMQQLLGQQSGAAQSLGSLISLIAAIPVSSWGQGEQGTSGSTGGFSI